MPRMPRKPRPTGDKATVARKRFYRSAERNLKLADQSSGATAARYRQLAKMDFENALNTYSPSTTQKFSKPITKLANEFGVSLEEERAKMKERSEKQQVNIRSRLIDIDSKESISKKALVSSFETDEERRETQARQVLNSPIGSRILGGFVDVWKDEASIVDEQGNLKVDQRKILPALFEHFGVDNLADLLEKVEEITGDKLYADEDSDSMYEAVKLTLQTHVAKSNNVVA